MTEKANKFYAVKRGRVVGVYRSWEECKSQIEGFPHPIFKSFENVTDALAYLDWSKEDKMKFINSGRKGYYKDRPGGKSSMSLQEAIPSITQNAKKPS